MVGTSPTSKPTTTSTSTNKPGRKIHNFNVMDSLLRKSTEMLSRPFTRRVVPNVGNVDVVLKLDVGAKVLHEVGLIIDAEVAIQSCQFFSKIVESKC